MHTPGDSHESPGIYYDVILFQLLNHFSFDNAYGIVDVMISSVKMASSKKSHHYRGFTIVELLIVIVVIAILASISIVAYNGIQQRARDTARKSDLSSIRNALEIRALDYDTALHASSNCTTGGAASGWFSNPYSGKTAAECLKSESQISNIFVDPSKATNCASGSPATCYAYMFCTSGTKTYIYAHLETVPTTDTSIDATGCSSQWDTNYGMNYYVEASAY